MFDGLPRPLLFAHRGASLQVPENTLEAFQEAVRVGADVLELDVHLSRDGEVVVFHDATLDRTTNGQGPLKDRTCAELRALDAGYRFEREGGFPFRGQGIRIPRLREVLQAFGGAAFNIEIKQPGPEVVQAVLSLLQGVEKERVVLAAGRDEIMSGLEKAQPRFPLGLSRGQVTSVLKGAYLARVPKKLRGRAMQVPPRVGPVPITNRWVISRAKRAGLEVHLWTINDPEVALAWLWRGVDGIMSDDPEAIAPVIARMRKEPS